MDVIETNIADVKLITPKCFGDKRGFFSEIYNRRILAEIGITAEFIQENHAYSADAGTLRGLHSNVRLRPRPSFSGSCAVLPLMSASTSATTPRPSANMSWPNSPRRAASRSSPSQGFAHGILTLKPHTEIAYKVDAYCAPELDLGVRFDDPELAIDWPFPEEKLILWDKDRHQPSFKELPEVFTFS